MANEAGKLQFLNEVFPAELQEINQRRRTLGLEAVDLKAGPSTERGLVGLAFSGGGIRSSTFCLGVVQALAERGVLRLVDYLSTVSGGGYVGSCLSSILNSRERGGEAERFPLRQGRGCEEPPALSHLRNCESYLSTGGAVDVLRIPALLLRGTLVNFSVLMPYLLLAVVLTDLFYDYGPLTLDSFKELLGLLAVLVVVPFTFLVLLVALFVYTVQAYVPLVLLLLPFALAVLFLLRPKRLNWKRRNAREFLLAVTFMGVLAGVVLLPLILLVDQAVVTPPSDLGEWWDAVRSWWVGGLALLLVFMLAGRISGAVARWSGPVMLWAVGLLGPVLLFTLYLLLCVLVIDPKNPGLRGDLEWVFLGALALLLLNRLFVNVNATSLHGYYRDRLSQAFLFRIKQEPGEVQGGGASSDLDRCSPQLESNDEQKLSALNQPGSAAPYHLINVTLNLQGCRDLSLRGRKGDFFVFSQRFTGGERTGFCRTELMEKADRRLDLGTAMAISGAAAAPNMGMTTMPALVFIMALLNIRLGYWLAHPALVRAPSWLQRIRLRLGTGPRYLLKEALGRVSDDTLFVNVSDGGHLENLGIYPLLRRRCRLIIAVDGEADPGLSFGGLSQVIRFARIDLGIDIKIDLSKIRPGPDGLSHSHWAVGEIHYGDQTCGHLLYFKSSLSGDENPYVVNYRTHHPAFPHESTANQFFTETQFEAYRALGYHVANAAFIPAAERRAGNTVEDILSLLRP